MNTHIVLSLFHIFFVVPFFLYVGLQRSATPNEIFTTLLVLGIVLTLYHGYKAYVRFVNASPFMYVNLIHALLIGPLLIMIGLKGKNTETPYYELLLMLTFAAGGYHLYSLVQQMNNLRDD
jgi:hypothetical protein